MRVSGPAPERQELQHRKGIGAKNHPRSPSEPQKWLVVGAGERRSTAVAMRENERSRANGHAPRRRPRVPREYRRRETFAGATRDGWTRPACVGQRTATRGSDGRGRGVREDAIALRRHRDLGAAATSVRQATSLPWPLLGQRTGCLTRGRAARRHKPIPQRETVRNGSSSELANVGRPLSQCARCERLS